MSHRKRHEMLRLKMSKSSEVVRFSFAKLLARVETRVFGDNHRRHWMERVRRHFGRRAMVAGNDKDVVFAK